MKRSVILAGVMFALAPSFAMSGEATELPPVEINGQKPALLAWPPALSTEITSEEVEAINSPDVSAALKYEPNLNVRNRHIGERNALLTFRDMHSFQTPRALVLGDGLLLSNFLGAGWDNAPRWSVMQPEEIERIEVIYGPYSAEYSGNALGGVVILHSRMPEAFEQHASAGTFVQQFDAFGTDDSYPGYDLHASIGDRAERFSYLVSADRLSTEYQPTEFNVTGEPVTANGDAVTGAYPHPEGFVYSSAGPTDLAEDVFKLKLGYDFTETLKGRLTLANIDRHDETLHPETYIHDAGGAPVYNGVVEIDGKSYTASTRRLGISDAREMVYGAELKGAVGDGWEIDAAASFYDVLDEQARESGTDHDIAQAGGPGTFSEDQGSGWQAFNLKLGHRHDAGWLGQRVLFGYHFDHYVLDKANFAAANWRYGGRHGNIAQLQGDSEGQSRTQAVFVENEWRLSQPVSLVLGARQEWWKAYGGSLARDNGADRVHAAYPGRSESAFSPKATLVYRAGSRWLASLSLGVANRFPTVGELYQGSLDNQGNFSAGFDPDLETEEGFAKNLMLRRFFDRATVTMNLWESDVDNTIFRQTDIHTGTSSFQNIERVRSRGVELVAAVDNTGVQGLTVDFNLSWTEARILENTAVPASEGSQFPRVPEWRANAFADYRVTDRLRVSGGARYSSDPYDTLDNSDGDLEGFGYTDGYLVFDARASMDLSDGLTLSGGIDNITDERYYVYHSYPGRTFFIELAWKH